MLEKIREESMLKGKIEGQLEGEMKKALETARKMKELGLSLETIIQSVGLSESQLRENGIL